MVDMVTASRAYEANARAVRLSRQASEDALSIMG
jgi:flagellar basal body rod protein FlgC